MKRLILFFSALLSLALPALAQIYQPVTWTVSSKKVTQNVYEIKANAKISSGWHIYDLQDYEGGPNPTVFTVSGAAVEAVAPAEITSRIDRAWNEVFQMEIGTCESP